MRPLLIYFYHTYIPDTKMNDRLNHFTKPASGNTFLKAVLLLVAALSASLPHCRAQGGIAVKGQIQKKIDKLLAVNINQDNIIQNTADTLENLYNESKKQGYTQGMQDAGIPLMAYYMNYGTYQKVMELGNDMQAMPSLSAENAANLHRLLGRAYSCLGFTDNAYTEYQTAVQFAKEIRNDSDIRHYTLAIAYQNYTNYFDRTKKYIDSIPCYDILTLSEARLIGEQSKTVSNDLKYGIIIATQYGRGLYYLYMVSPPDSVLAGKYFLEALKIYEARKGKIPEARKTDLFTTVSEFYFSQKKYDSSIRCGLKALDAEKESPSPYKRALIYKILGNAYDAKHDEEQSLKYLKLFAALNSELDGSEKTAIKDAIKQITYLEQKIAADRQRKLIGIAAGIVLAILLIAFLLWKRNKIALQKKYGQLIEKLKASHEKVAETPETTAADEAIPETVQEAANDGTGNADETVKEPYPVNVPDETVAMLLGKLEKFERLHKYLKKDITLISLAHQFSANPRYLSEVVRRHRNKGFSHYINSLKINYITYKLYEEAIYREYKINHLAEECGFSSRQVFVLAFKKETGVTPSYFISRLKGKKT